MRVENLFPTPVAFWNFNITDEEKDYVRNLEQRPNQGNTTSKQNYLLFEEPMERISEIVS